MSSIVSIVSFYYFIISCFCLEECPVVGWQTDAKRLGVCFEVEQRWNINVFTIQRII